MNAPARLGLYGLGLVGAFGAAFLIAGAVVPDAAVEARTTATDEGHDAHAEPSTDSPRKVLGPDGRRRDPVTWLLWLFVHIMFLVGFRNRASVLLQWAASYLTYQRSVRLITGHSQGS